jgi:lipase chaperone LimK
MRSALLARQRVRQQHFTPEEYEALFGQEARLDQFTLARLGVEQQSGLSDAQKRAALEAAEQLLSPAQRAQRAESTVYAGVQAQTAAFDSANTSAQERFAQRSAQFGPQAATRLAQLDAEDRQWQSSLDQYAQARAGLGANPPSAEQALALSQLRQQLFTPEQQARVDAGLELRALNAARPANNTQR